MASFTPSAKQASDFNNGNKYVNHVDSPSADDFNNVIESQLYTQGLAKNTPDTSEANNVGTPSVNVVAAFDGSARFKFSNLKGAGIFNIVPNGTDQNGNNLYTINLTDGTSYSFTSPKGSQGIQGVQGIGISNITPNGQDSSGGNIYKITLTDGSSYNFTAPKGSQGIQGIQGVGISNITLDSVDTYGNNVYKITLTDGSSYNFTAPKGEQGESGVTNVEANTISQENGYTTTPITFYFETGNTKTVDVKAKNGAGTIDFIEIPSKGTALNNFTWEELKIINEKFNILDWFSLGETKTFTIGSETINARFVDTHYGDQNGMLFFCSGMSTQYMLFTGNRTEGTTGGYAETVLVNTLNNTLYNNIQSDLRNIIKECTVKYNLGGTTKNSSLGTGNYKLFIPSSRELTGSSNYYNGTTNIQEQWDLNDGDQIAYFASNPSAPFLGYAYWVRPAAYNTYWNIATSSINNRNEINRQWYAGSSNRVCFLFLI